MRSFSDSEEPQGLFDSPHHSDPAADEGSRLSKEPESEYPFTNELKKNIASLKAYVDEELQARSPSYFSREETTNTGKAGAAFTNPPKNLFGVPECAVRAGSSSHPTKEELDNVDASTKT
ncbi:hypothetical protein DXG01_007084 [Tephrocybe rancida]|nr:hypothetical protein DXG01_007084 [Tephrocybe rancida]